MLWIKNLGLLILVPGIATGLLPWWILRINGITPVFKPDLLSILAVLVFLCGAGMVVWVVWAFTAIGKGTPAPFDPPREFVARGLYRCIRNPMYSGALTMLLAETVYFRSLSLLVYSAWTFLFLHLFVVFFEEPDLQKRFGQTYRDYLASTPRWIPLGIPRRKEIKNV